MKPLESVPSKISTTMIGQPRCDVEEEPDRAHAPFFGGLEVWYQKICDLRSLEAIGAEALVRLRSPEGGVRLPGEFLPTQDLDAMAFLDYKILERVLCDARREWRRGLPPSFSFQVNMSAGLLAHGEYFRDILQLLEIHQVPPPALVFEITESAPLDVSRAAPIVQSLLRRGCRFALDDFGVGFSNLNYLTRLPVQQLKLDRSLIADLERGSRARKVIRQVVRMAEALDAQVVAEGIEKPQQVEELLALGCTRGQGFLLSRPVPAPLVADGS